MFKLRFWAQMFYFILLFSFLVTPLKVSSKQDILTGNPEYKEAYARIEAKDYKGAINILDRLLKMAGRSAGLHYALGKAWQELGDNKIALYNYDKSIALDSKNPKAFSNRGLIHGAMRNLKAAIADFDKAILIDPRYDHAYSNRGVARGALGDNRGAVADFSKAISINPRFSSAWRNRGITLEMQGNLKGACADWRKAANLGQVEAMSWVKIQCN